MTLRSLLVALALTATAALLAGCNTMEGLGKDIATAGKKLEETAK